MINAQEEFVLHIEGNPEVKCAAVSCGGNTFNLPVGFDEHALDTFLECLSFDYDDGFGGQELFGTIWYTDGTFSQRGEYDGSEWWEYVKCPEVPDELK